jgi:hypothetical protein
VRARRISGSIANSNSGSFIGADAIERSHRSYPARRALLVPATKQSLSTYS